MADGGFDNGNPDLDNKLDNDGDDEQEVDTARPSQPGTASTPYHNGEQVELHRLPPEKSGPAEKSFIEDDRRPLLIDFLQEEDIAKRIENAKNIIKGNYPEVDKEKLGPIIFSKKERNQNNIVVLGPKGGEIEIFKKDGSFRKLFPNSFKEALGPSAKEIVAKLR